MYASQLNLTLKVGARTGSSLVQQLEERQRQQMQVIIEQTLYEIKKSNPERALNYVLKVLSIKPDSIECLTFQSKCFVDLHMYKEAKEAANNILTRPDCTCNWIALYSKGDSNKGEGHDLAKDCQS